METSATSIDHLRDLRTASACARASGQKNNSVLRWMMMQANCRGHKRRPSIGYHFTEPSQYGRAPAPRCPGAGAPATAPFRLPSNSCWSSSRTGSRVLVGRQGTVAAYGSRTTRASSRLRSVGWLVIGSKPERVGASRQQVETKRYRSSGRHDVSGCLRPCLIAYYDLCFLGTDSRMAAGFV